MLCCLFFFFFKQKTAYEMRISDWSSDVCSSDLCCGVCTQLSCKAPSRPLAKISTPDMASPCRDTGVGKASPRPDPQEPTSTYLFLNVAAGTWPLSTAA